MIAVITINYNLSPETIPCVESVLASSNRDIRVFLVDNGSREEDYQNLVRAFGDHPLVEILRIENNCGYVGGVNHGLTRALEDKPEYFLVMNNDTVIDPQAVDHLVNAARRYNNRAIVTGMVYYFDKPDVIQHTGEIITDRRLIKTIAPGKNEVDTGQFNQDLERDALDDVFWLLPAPVVEEVGLYCNYFFLYAEQGDYALRAVKKGFKLVFTPWAKLWHKVSMTAGNGDTMSVPVCYWRGQGMFMLHFRHMKRFWFLLTTAEWFFNYGGKALFKSGKARKCSRAMFRGYFWGFRWMLNKKPNNGRNPYLNS